MSRGHGKNLSCSLDDSAGTPRDITGHVTSVTGLPGNRALADVTAAGDAGDKSIPGRASASVTINGWLDTAATTGSYVVLNGLRTTTATATIIYGPMGTTTGFPKETAELWLESLVYDASIDGAVPFVATFKMDGVSTSSVY